MLKFFTFCAIVGFAAALSPQVLHSVSGDEAHAQIKSLHSDVRADGFEYAMETSNGIVAHESGDAYGNVHGDYSYISPEGEHIQVSYVADENGYQPNSAILPTAPPIPHAILKALDYIRTHPPKEEHLHGHHASLVG